LLFVIKILSNFIVYSTPVKISTTLVAKFSISAVGSADINSRILLTGNGKLTKTALSLLAAR